MDQRDDFSAARRETVGRLLHKLIVSVQASEDTPLYGPVYIKAMAESVIMGGAEGIRACWPEDIAAVRSVTDLPIVGIYKAYTGGDPLDSIYITPGMDEVKEIVEAGADIIGVDCTLRPFRDLGALKEFLLAIRETYPKIPVMADLATLDEGIAVAETGLVDIISTTLNGYTRESAGDLKETPNTDLIRELKRSTDIPVNGEGRIWTLEDLGAILEAGADMVTIGSAITRPQLITQRYLKFEHEWLAENGRTLL